MKIQSASPTNVLSIISLTENILLRELPQLEPGRLPPGYFDFKDDDAKKPPELRDIDAERLANIASSSTAPAAPPAPPETSKDGRKLTKGEKKKVA